MTRQHFIVSSLVVSLGTAAGAATFNIPADFGTIQAAIDAASSGDEIVVSPGVYTEALDYLGKSVTVRSTNGPAATWIDADGQGGSAVVFENGEDANAVLEGFTLAYGQGQVPSGSSLESGGGVLIVSSSPTIRDCRIRENIAEIGGGMAIYWGSPTIERCTILQNESTLASGGGIYSISDDVTIRECRFLGNSAGVGGGLGMAGGGSTLVVNCFFAGNASNGNFGGDGNGGGAIHADQGMQLTIVNSTFVGNTANSSGGSRGGGIHTDNDTTATTITNSIFWGNLDSMGFPQISEGEPGITTVTHSCVEGGWVGNGSSNLNSDPMFVDADGGDDTYGTPDDDAALAEGSPCIDVGDDSAVPAGVTTDLLGNDRFSGSAVDMGAVELQVETPCAADLDGSGAVDFGDLLTLLGSWGDCGGCAADLDGDGAVAFGDLLILLADWGACD